MATRAQWLAISLFTILPACKESPSGELPRKPPEGPAPLTTTTNTLSIRFSGLIGFVEKQDKVWAIMVNGENVAAAPATLQQYLVPHYSYLRIEEKYLTGDATRDLAFYTRIKGADIVLEGLTTDLDASRLNTGTLFTMATDYKDRITGKTLKPACANCSNDTPPGVLPRVSGRLGLSKGVFYPSCLITETNGSKVSWEFDQGNHSAIAQQVYAVSQYSGDLVVKLLLHRDGAEIFRRTLKPIAGRVKLDVLNLPTHDLFSPNVLCIHADDPANDTFAAPVSIQDGDKMAHFGWFYLASRDYTAQLDASAFPVPRATSGTGAGGHPFCTNLLYEP